MASNSYDSNSMSKVTQFQKMNNFIKYNKWMFFKEWKQGFHCNRQVLLSSFIAISSI